MRSNNKNYERLKEDIFIRLSDHVITSGCSSISKYIYDCVYCHHIYCVLHFSFDPQLRIAAKSNVASVIKKEIISRQKNKRIVLKFPQNDQRVEIDYETFCR